MRKKSLLIIVIFVVVIGFFIKWLLDTTQLSPVVTSYVLHRDADLKQTDGHTNILILGIGGGTHDGPDLSDTMILASLDAKKNNITLISIPRDLWIPDLHAKINAAYAIGQEQQRGLLLAKTTVENTIHQPIHYGFRIDFDGFVKAVDLLGGLDITVDRTFDDYQYPIEGKENATCGHTDTEIASLSAQLASTSATITELDAFPCRYEHLHIDQGLQHMDGIIALKYVRSRHAAGSEGSDFARSKRQEKIISAVKEKVFSLQTILNPVKLISLYNIVKSSIDTDVQENEFGPFITLVQKLKTAKMHNAVLDTGDEETKRSGLLVVPPIDETYGRAWVLIPRIGNGDFSEIQNYVACEITIGNCSVAKQPEKKEVPTVK